MKKWFYTMIACALALSTHAGTVTYTGASGNWATAANWTPAQVPTVDDDVTINASKIVSLDYTASVRSLRILNGAHLSVAGATTTAAYRAPKDAVRTDPVGINAVSNVLVYGTLSIGGLNQACLSYLTVGGHLMVSNNLSSAAIHIYAGLKGETNDVETYKTGGARVTVAGKTLMGGTHASNTSVIYPYCHRISGAPVVFDLQDLTVEKQGWLWASDRGHSRVVNSYYGLGQGRASTGGGGYGGTGGGNLATAAGLPYGWAYAPYFPGSPGRDSEATGNGAGGGAIRILARDVNLDGKLLADGAPFWMNLRGAGSGGGIWITCTNFTAGADALISAKGGDGIYALSYTFAGGSGGRVAILTGGPTPAQVNSLYATGEAEGLIAMPMSESSYPSLVTVDGGLNLYNYYNDVVTDYHGQPGTAFFMTTRNGAYQVTVSGDPIETGTAVPAYGVHRIENGNLEASVASPSPVTGSDNNSRMTCSGYLWSNATESVSSAGTTVTLNVTNDTWLLWNWTDLEHRLTARSSGYGTVSAHDEWQNDGATCEITAVPDVDCTFLYWVGDVPAADRTSATITLTMDSPHAVTACFAGPTPRSLSANASANGDWFDVDTWDGVAIPGPADSVTVSGVDVYVAVPAEITVAQLTLTSSAFLHIGGIGTTVTAQSPITDSDEKPVSLAVTGPLTLKDTAKLSMGGLNSAYRSLLSVGGDLWITNTAQIAVYAGLTGLYNELSTVKNGGARVTVDGTTTVATGTWIHPFCHQKSGAPVIFNLQDLAVAVNAGFNAQTRGFSSFFTYDFRYGPGTPAVASAGGSYGGMGGGTSKAVYGWDFAPYWAGSPGRYNHLGMGSGGGVIRILARKVTLEGHLLADGGYDGGNTYGAGSGGSVWVTCSNFTAGASARIQVVGGRATQHGGCGAGGAGRIAIMTDVPTTDQLDDLYATGNCDDLIVVTTDMTDPVLSPYPNLCYYVGGTNHDQQANPAYAAHGKPGTAVWLRNKGDNWQVTVAGDPDVYGTPLPAYGVRLLPSGSTVFASGSPAFIPDSNERSRLHSLGYSWTNSAAQSGSGATTYTTLNITADTELTWYWGNPEHRLDVRSGGNGTVTEDYSTWYTEGASVTLTAVPDAGRTFLYWVGDVPYADRANTQITLTMNQPRTAVACFTTAAPDARTLVWKGGNGTNDWFNPTSWDGVAIPGIYDSVTITNGQSSVAYPSEMTLASLTVAQNGKFFLGGNGSSATTCTPVDSVDPRPYRLTITGDMVVSNAAQFAVGGLNPTSRVELAVGGDLLLDHTAMLAIYAAYTGPTNDVATYKTGGARVSVGGKTTLNGSSWIHPFCDQRSGAPVIFDLHDLTIAATAGFNANYGGFGRTTLFSEGYWTLTHYGPGKGTVEKMGGSYGGQGGGNTAGSVYGYTNAPFYPGSPAMDTIYDFYSQWAGGAIRINANNVLLNGTLTANGSGDRTYQGSSSGGGIWVTCNGFALGETAMLSAKSGVGYNYSYCNSGGGGRIAIGLKLSPGQIDRLYATGNSRGALVQNLADLPEFTGKFSIEAGVANQGIAGQSGSAILMVAPPAGTMLILR